MKFLTKPICIPIIAAVGNPMIIGVAPGTEFKTDTVRYALGSPCIIADIPLELPEGNREMIAVRISAYPIDDIPEHVSVCSMSVFGVIYTPDVPIAEQTALVLHMEHVDLDVFHNSSNRVNLLDSTKWVKA